MFEVWKDVSGYEGFYQVSNLGRIKRVEHVDKFGHVFKERFLKITSYKRGYARVHLSKNGIAEWILVHRIVAKAFVPQIPGCDIVNHLDNDPSNNAANNLEWTTYKGNMQYAAMQGRMKYNPDNLMKAQRAKEIPVVAIKDGKRTWYKSGAEAGRLLGIRSGHIAAACRKEYGYKTVGGYEWEYADPELQEKQAPKKKSRDKADVSRALRDRMLGDTIMNGRKLSQDTKNKLSKANGRPVIQFKKTGEYVAEYHSANDAMRKTGIRHINTCANGKRKSAGGYVWRWKE